jgi:predicted secreted hydrolase
VTAPPRFFTRRRALLAAAAASATAAWPGAAGAQAVRRGRVLTFPRDHGAHPDTRTEWWYATAWLGEPERPTHGVQITFFRSRTGFGERSSGRFGAPQLLLAHAAVVDLAPGGRHHHDQRIVRWNGNPQGAAASAAEDQGRVRLRDWSLVDAGTHWHAVADGPSFAFDLQLARTQPLLLQGDAGFSRKGPEEAQASHYYSEVQLEVGGSVVVDGRRQALRGRAWLDHEWSDEVMHRDAVGWEWIGINGFDGSALTAFRLRRADGGTLWAGGSHRVPGAAVQAFEHTAVQWQPGRRWRSPTSGASYPVEWQVTCPAGRYTVRALADAQELDSRASTGTIYWEGVSELLDGAGRRIGLGYLEMTGYGAPIRL